MLHTVQQASCVCAARFCANVKEVLTTVSLGALLNTTSAWNYIDLNAPQSLFEGYSWSLDTFVDYCYSQLGELSIVLIILLVVEVRKQ